MEAVTVVVVVVGDGVGEVVAFGIDVEEVDLTNDFCVLCVAVNSLETGGVDGEANSLQGNEFDDDENG